METKLLLGDCLEKLKELPDCSVNCCVTSPPYFGLRDYGVDGQIGLEETPALYVERLVTVFREVRRVLRDDGTLWLNLGDSYCGSGGAGNQFKAGGIAALGVQAPSTWKEFNSKVVTQRIDGLKPKDLIGIPWRVAFALQSDGWYLRQDIIWHKPNPMPESVKDRCTKAHEYIFMFSKKQRYYFDSEAMKEPSVMKPQNRNTKRSDHPKGDEGRAAHRRPEGGSSYETRNRRSVWTVATKPYKGAHFATYPPELIRPCIQAGCPPQGTVLDPFGGSGTTAQVALEEGRNAIICELNPEYLALAETRITAAQATLASRPQPQPDLFDHE